METSWACFFRHHVLPGIPVQKMCRHFSNSGRPTKELYSSLGAPIVQQTFDPTDSDLLYRLAFNAQWHYALNIAKADDNSAYMCPKTLYSIRCVIIEHDLWDTLFNSTAGSSIELFNVNTDRQRLDSTHIRSNMKSLGRIGVFSQTIHKFPTNLKRQSRPLFDRLPEELVSKYPKRKQLSSFSMVKPSKSAKTSTSLSQDLLFSVRRFTDNPLAERMKSFSLLKRVLHEQCELVRQNKLGKNHIAAEPKTPKEIPGNSLRNPSDPSAGYDGHKGKGYRVQVMETRSENKSDRQPNLIAHIAVEPARKHDSKAVVPAIEDAEEKGVKPKELLADSLYGNDDNTQKAKRMGVDLISPIPVGASKLDRLHLSDFRLDGKNRVLVCPNNRQPISQKVKNESVSTKFDKNHCDACPLRAKCPVRDSKKNTYIRYRLKDFGLAGRRQYEKTPAFIEKYAFRAGVEATMSEYKRVAGVDRLRVRGLESVSYCATLKALGINILRSAKAYQKRGVRPSTPLDAVVSHHYFSMAFEAISGIRKAILKLRFFKTEIVKMCSNAKFAFSISPETNAPTCHPEADFSF